MAKVDKIIAKMLNQPNGITLREAEKVLNHYGFYCTRIKGSHRYFTNLKLKRTLTIVDNKPLKIVYIKDILAIIESIN